MTLPDQTILIIEDDLLTRELYQRELSQRFRVFSCADEQSALAVLQTETISAVVLEPALPREEGWSLLATIRATPRTKMVPVILCSTVDERKRGILAGATAYLIKPVLPATLQALLWQMLTAPMLDQNTSGTNHERTA